MCLRAGEDLDVARSDMWRERMWWSEVGRANWNHIFVGFNSVQSLSHVWLCNRMNCSTAGLSVHHHLLEFTQTQVHWVSDAIQPSHPLSSPSPPAPTPSQRQSFPMSQLFAWGGQSTRVSALASFLPKNTQRDDMGWEVGGGFRIGSSYTPVVDSCQCMAKPIQYCKVK